MKTRCWWLILALLPGFASARGQPTTPPAYLITTWTTDHGLPQNSVYNITQTRDGYLWFTTLDGLVRFDGVRFTVFDKNNSPGFTSNRLICVFEDKDGALWIGTEDAGVMRYADGVFTSLATKDGLPHNHVFAIQAVNTGGLQLATLEGYVFWRDNRLWPDPDRVNDDDLHRYHAPSGPVWTLDQTGLRRLKDGVTTRYPRLIEPDEVDVAALYEDRQGNLWLGANTPALFKVKDGTVTRYALPDNLPARTRLNAFCEDRQGNLWISTNGVGLIRFADGQFTVLTERDGLSDNKIHDLVLDREGNLWAGTNAGGLNRLSRHFMTVFSTANGLQDNNVYPLLQDRASAIWIGADGSLTRYSEGKFSNYDLRDERGIRIHVQSLYEDRAGRLWVGHYGGFGLFKDGAFNVVKAFPKRPVFAIHEDRDGHLWIGSENGLFKCKDGACNEYDTSNGLPEKNVKVIHEDRRGELWIGTYSGLARLAGGKFTWYTERDGLTSNHVRYLHEDADGTFWIGTYDGGLSRFREGRFTNYSVRNGLYNNGVFQILEDAHGVFWIGCNKGIYRVSKQQLNDYADGRISAIICTAYGKQDGMTNAECNGGRQPAGLRARDGRLWFPTLGGTVVIDPEAAPLNELTPPVQIEAVVLDKTNVPLTDDVRIAPQQKYLEISYTGLSFIKSEQVQFKYRLTGQDSDWQDAGTRRVAYYSYLPPGRYTFTVIAANADGVWNTQGVSLRIVVVPPFWRTSWFLSLASLGVASVMLLAFRQRLARLQRAHAAQEAFSRQLLASQEAERQRIAAELHDSLGQSLLIIKNRAFLALETFNEAETAREQIGEISSASARAIEEVREIAYNLRPYQLDRFGLTSTLEAICEQAELSSGIRFTAHLENIDGLFAKEAEINVYRIVQESLNNILKHSQATEASLSIERLAGKVRLRIMDNGGGFEIADAKVRQAPNFTNSRSAANPQSAIRNPQSGGFGLIGIAERVRMLKGVYEIKSAPGRGATITITLNLEEQGDEK